MELEDLYKLSKSKREVMFKCVHFIALADGKISDEEAKILTGTAVNILKLEFEDVKKIVNDKIDEQTLNKVYSELNLMSGDELGLLGMIMGHIASADGNFDSDEKALIEKLLTIGRLNPSLINQIVDSFANTIRSNARR